MFLDKVIELLSETLESCFTTGERKEGRELRTGPRVWLKVTALVSQSCLTLCGPVDCSPPDTSVHGILQARILEWEAVPFSADFTDPGIKPRSPTQQANFPCGSTGKQSARNAGDLGLIPRLGRSPGEGNGFPFQYSGLENSIDCIVCGVTESLTWLSDFHFHSHFITVWSTREAHVLAGEVINTSALRIVQAHKTAISANCLRFTV